MNKKLTPWYGDFTTPHRIGYYETKWLWSARDERVRYWDGEFWCEKKHGARISLQCFYWRGLAKKP